MYMSPYINMYLEEYSHIDATMHVTTMCKVVDAHISCVHMCTGKYMYVQKCLHTTGLEVYVHTYMYCKSRIFHVQNILCDNIIYDN